MTWEPAVVRTYTRIIERTLRKYRSHPQWEDLLSAATLTVWTRLMRLPEEKRLDAGGYVVFHTRSAARDFLVGPENRSRRHGRHGTPIVPEVSLDALTEDESRLHAVEPDFAPMVIERLWRASVWEEAKRAMTAEEWQVTRLHLAGVAFRDMGGSNSGRSTTNWRKFQRGIKKAGRGLRTEG